MNEQEFLDSLAVNSNSGPEGRRSLSRQEIFILAWLINNSTGRAYRDMMRDCKMSLQQCKTAIEELIELDLLRIS